MTTLSAPLDVTPRSATALVEQCRAQIDKDLAALLESLCVLRSRRNGLARISCLPPEILASIFKCITEEEAFKSYPEGTPRRHCAPACLIVTHVCRHWRQVALDCPALWAYIDCASTRWLPIMLERSKNAALVISYGAQVLQPCLEQVLSQLPRIKVLQLSLFPSNFCRVLKCLSSHPAPLLQIFELSVAGSHYPTIIWPVSDAIFQGQVPQLRSVELMRCSFSWTSCIFSGLRTLYIRDIGFDSTLSQLLSALRRMSSLEQLSLRLSLDSEEMKVLDKVPLPRLKHIVLDYIVPTQTVVSLFAHLALPVDVTIALHLGTVEGSQGFSDLFAAMNKDPDEFGSTIQSLRTSLLYGVLGVQFSTSTVFKSDYSWNPREGDICDDDIRLSIQFEYDSEFNSAVVFDVCRIITQHKIQNLYVPSCFDLPEHFWRAGSAALPELKAIYLSMCPVGDLITALRCDGVQESDIVYPSLHTLEFEVIDFEPDEPRNLQEVVSMRAKHGVCIRKLRFAMCKNLMNKQVQLLEEVVTDVDWDGHEESSKLASLGCTCPTCTWDGDSDSQVDSESEPDPDYDVHSEE